MKKCLHPILDCVALAGCLLFASPGSIAGETLAASPSSRAADRPNDPWFADQWPLHADACPRALGLVAAWRSLGWPDHAPGERNPSRVVVIDTGVNTGESDCRKHFDPTSLTRVGHELGGEVRGAGPSPAAAMAAEQTDCHGHGTAIASIIGAVGDNGVGIAGALWPIEILSCRAAPTGIADATHLAACLAWVAGLVDAGLQISAVNVSLRDDKPDARVRAEIRALRDRGVLVVAAAGNDSTTDNDRAGSHRSFPASYSLSNVISVAAVDRNGDLFMSRSGRRTVHVAAPGRDIPAVDPSTREMRLMQGTSPATAYVTALVALLAVQDPTRDWRALRNLVLAGGAPVDALAGEIVTGRAICATGEGGIGSLTCKSQRVLRRISPTADDVSLGPGDMITLKFISVDCAASVDPGELLVTGTSKSKMEEGPLVLRDDGRGADESAGDGEWSATWTAPPSGTYYIRPAGSRASTESLTVRIRRPRRPQ